MEDEMKKHGTILVTGGAGYIGRHVVKALMNSGYFTVVLDNGLTRYCRAVPGSVTINGKIEDPKLLSRLFTRYDIEAVMHFAAYSEAVEATIDPIKYHRNNFSGTLVLLESMLNYGVRRFIFSSSAAVYGESEYTPMDEKHPCHPTTRHGESKYFVEKVLHDCSLTHGLRYMALRHFGVAGYNPNHATGVSNRKNTDIITGMIDTAAGINPSFEIYGTDYGTPDGTCIRDYVHVSDVADAYIAALQSLLNGARSSVYNIGTGRGHSVKQVLETVRKVTGRNVTTIAQGVRSGDPAILIADAARICSELGWQPRFEDLEAIIQTTWAWHQKQAMPN